MSSGFGLSYITRALHRHVCLCLGLSSFSRCCLIVQNSDRTLVAIVLVLVLLDGMAVCEEACPELGQEHTWWRKKQLGVEIQWLYLQIGVRGPGIQW